MHLSNEREPPSRGEQWPSDVHLSTKTDGEGRSAMSGDALRAAIHAVAEGRALRIDEMKAAMNEVLEGEGSEALIAALAMGLRVRGETTDEILAAAEVMRTHCRAVSLRGEGPLLDTCGTGGDGSGSFNVSTASAIVVAACGVRVAKHGNRAVSSRSGSADVLEALGLRIDLPVDRLRASVDDLGIGFLFAPAHHGALRHAAPVRRALGLRTFFNLLGPLTNPAGATHQLVGVYDPSRTAPLAEVLGRLGGRRAWVVHGHGGLDEVSPLGPTKVSAWADGRVEERIIAPEDFGLERSTEASLAGGDAVANATIVRAVLAGQPIPQRAAVVLNAAAALVVAEQETELLAARRRVESALDDGSAVALLERWIEFSQPGDPP
ncbi:MAG: anthranilate phosphoribosyltransferase [Myxococcota bacterium]